MVEEEEMRQVEVSREESRDQAIDLVLQSTSRLNTMFQQLSEIVLTQGTLLDRIDFNLEDTQHQVSQGRL